MNTATTLEQAREQAAAAIAAKMAEAKAKVELSLLTNEKFQNALVNQKIREESTSKLAALEAMCESIVNDNPIYSKTLKKDRTWNPSRIYGYGNQVATLSGILSGIQYSVSEHSALMLAATGLTADLVEATLEAFGNLPYYSSNYGTVVDGKLMNVELVRDNLDLIAYSLGIQIDKSAITQQQADRLYASAQAKAEKAQAEQQLGAAMEQYVIVQ